MINIARKNVTLACEFFILSFGVLFLVDKEKVGMFVVRSIVCLQIVIFGDRRGHVNQNNNFFSLEIIDYLSFIYHKSC